MGKTRGFRAEREPGSKGHHPGAPGTREAAGSRTSPPEGSGAMPPGSAVLSSELGAGTSFEGLKSIPMLSQASLGPPGQCSPTKARPGAPQRPGVRSWRPSRSQLRPCRARASPPVRRLSTGHSASTSSCRPLALLRAWAGASTALGHWGSRAGSTSRYRPLARRTAWAATRTPGRLPA